METATAAYPKLSDVVDISRLKYHVENGNVTVRRHNELPLRIYNYTSKAQYSGDWGDGTIDWCRGLIVDDNDDIIARPFKKFHNLNASGIAEAQERNLPKTEPVVLEKLDGSLGIMYRYAGYTGIATRGSFHSPQADWANQWLKDHVSFCGPITLPDSCTPLFEIIYNENRIVCKYDYEGLVLLACVCPRTGSECPYWRLRAMAEQNKLRCVELCNKTLAACLQEDEKGKEGYVLSYYMHRDIPPVKVKVKFADYVRLHRIVTGTNPVRIWEALSAGNDLAELLDTPEDFKKWVFDWRNKLVFEFNNIYGRCSEIYTNRPVLGDTPFRTYRKECARYFFKEAGDDTRLPGILFLMLDGKDPVPHIWKAVKPEANDKSFTSDEEGEDDASADAQKQEAAERGKNLSA